MTARQHAGNVRPFWVPAVALAATLTLAGLVWLKQSSALAAAGRQIYDLEERRQDLLQQRAALLIQLEETRDHGRLEQRARDLGFGPPAYVTYVRAAVAGQDGARLGPIDPHSPLALITHSEGVGAPTVRPGVLDRLLARTTRSASAHQLRLTVAEGSVK